MLALVDDEDFTRVDQFNWYADKIGSTYYAKRRVRDGGKSTTISMHRFITNTESGMDVDHKDKNGLNNQKSNLRVCTRSQNMWNQRPQKNGKSKYLGVSFDKRDKKWKAQICTHYKRKVIGRFNSEDDAAMAYNSYARHLHGEFAHINILQK